MDGGKDLAEEALLLRFMEAALSGSAAAIASRHDFNPERLAKLAHQVALAAVEELKGHG